MRTLVAPVLFAQPKYKGGEAKKQMLPFSTLQDLAQEHYPQLSITTLRWYHYGKEGAKVRFRGYDKENVAQSGRVNRPSITLDASSGAVVEHKTLDKHMASAEHFQHFISCILCPMRHLDCVWY